MFYSFRLIILFFFTLIIISCNSRNEFEITRDNLSPLYPLKRAARPDDWLYTRKVINQSLDDYIMARPTGIDSVRKKIYIMLIGDFDSAQKDIAFITAQYLQAFYGLETRVIEMKKSFAVSPKSRNNPGSGQLQLSASYLMDSVLQRQLPIDAAVLLGLTTIDLYPGNNWNYIFGLGSSKERVGVLSIYRFGDPNKENDKEICLLRTIKTATHEMGHILSLPHCSKFECCMNGSNTLSELTNKPTYFCPDCLIKISSDLKYDVREHLQQMKNFWQMKDNKQMCDFYNQNLEVLK